MYWTAAMISGLGDAVFVVALSWMVVEATGSGVILGTLLMAMGIPHMILTIVGGVVVDRLNPRLVMIASDLLRAVVMGVLVLFSTQGIPPLWMLFVMAVLFGAVDAFFWPAASAMRQGLVTKEYYTQSSGLLMMASQTTGLIGPMLAVWLISGGNYAVVLASNGISFVVSALCLTRVRVQAAEEKSQGAQAGEKRSFRADMAEGIRYVLKTPVILTTSLVAFVVNACLAAALISLPFLAQELQLGAGGFASMTTAIAVGGAVGAVLFSVVAIRNPTPSMTLLACLIEGVMFLLIALTGQLWLLMLLLIVVGVMETAVNTIAPSVNQAIIPKRLFGRVISVMILLMSSSDPAAKAAAGWLLDRTDAQTIFLGSGIIEILVCALAFSLPAIRHFGKGEGNAQGMEKGATM